MTLTKGVKSGRWRMAADDLPINRQEYGIRQSFPEEAGGGETIIQQIDSGLSYIQTVCTPSRDMAVLSRMGQEPRLVVTLGMRGHSRFVGSHGEGVAFGQGYTTITAFHSSVGERHYSAGVPVSQLRFSMARDWLEKYVGKDAVDGLFHESGVRTLSFRSMAPQTRIAAHHLTKTQPSGLSRPLHLHAQVLSILAAELSPLWGDPGRDTSRFSQRDRDIAHAARDILNREFQHPPSVAALARRVGTNQLKLTDSFRHFFHTTPYGMLLDIRMHTAHRLLDTTHCPVNIAATAVGYNHASNFSAAFSKYFGISPKQV